MSGYLLAYFLGGGAMLGTWLWLEERWPVAAVVAIGSVIAALFLFGSVS